MDKDIDVILSIPGKWQVDIIIPKKISGRYNHT